MRTSFRNSSEDNAQIGYVSPARQRCESGFIKELVAVFFGVVLLQDIHVVVGVCLVSLDVLEMSWRRVSSMFGMFLFIDRVAMSSIVC